MESAPQVVDESMSLGSSWEVASTKTAQSDEWEVVSEVDLTENPIVIEGDRPYVSIGSEEGRQWLDIIKKDTERMTSQLREESEASDSEGSERDPSDTTSQQTSKSQSYDDDEWVIDTIVQRKRQHGEVYYRVLWKSYGYTWESEEWLEDNDYGDWVDAYENGTLKTTKSTPPKEKKSAQQLLLITNRDSGVNVPAAMQSNPYFCPETVWPDFGTRITTCANAVYKQVLSIRNIVSKESARKFSSVARKADMEQYGLVMLYAQLPAYFAGSMKDKLAYAVQNLKLILPFDSSIRDVLVFAGIVERETLTVVSVLPCFVATVADMKSIKQSILPRYLFTPPCNTTTNSTSGKSTRHPAVPEPYVDQSTGAWLHRGALKEALAKRHSDKDIKALPVWLKKFQKEGLLRGRRIDRSRERLSYRSSQPRSSVLH